MTELTRREGLGLAALAAGAATLGDAMGTGALAATPSFLTTLDFKNPKWNRDTYVRLDADIDPAKEKIGWHKGRVYGVRPNEPVRTLFINEGFSFTRVLKLPDGSFRRMCREVVFYRDVETGKLLDHWHNPYTNETVKVVPIYNDPFNFTIGEFLPEGPSYGGLNKTKAEKKPFLLDWRHGPNGTVILQTDIHLYYPAALQPDQWPMESAGVMTRASELFTYVLKRADLENPKLTHLPVVGSWSRITPWLPWMLMGQAPGNITFFNTFATLESLDQVPADVVDAARAISPKFLSAPTEDYGPSLSSNENYARFEKPAPVPAGWKPPQPPPTPMTPIHMPMKG